MSLQRISIMISSILIAFLIIGSARLLETFYLFRNTMLDKNTFLDTVKASGCNVMDDFRRSGFDIIPVYSSENLKETALRSEDGILKVEEEGLRYRLFPKVEKENTVVFLKQKGLNRRGLRGSSLGRATLSERPYFFGYGGCYHKRKECRNLHPKEMRFFHSMEEAALQGLPPCNYCILESGR